MHLIGSKRRICSRQGRDGLAVIHKAKVVEAIKSTGNVKEQYSNDKNLATRITLHEKYSTNKQGFAPWLFGIYRFLPNNTVLELGCGNGGQWDGRIGLLPRDCRLILSDNSEGMVNVTKSKFEMYSESVSFRQIDIQNIPFEDNSFDAIIANHMLYHVPDLRQALSEVCRVLKKGGIFYASTNGNGGMSLFLHNAVKKFDADTAAFAQDFPFSLQNGSEILSPFFSLVTRHDYKDSLSITKTKDLMDWIKSIISIYGCNEETLGKLHDYFDNIRRRDGCIHIPKEVGVFVCIKNGAGL